MPPRALLRGFLGLWLTTGVVLLVASVATAWSGMAERPHANPHLVVLGAVEAMGALLFVVPRAMRWGATLLLATIGVAFAVHTALGQFRGDLLIYAAVVAFVLVHGPLTGPQWRAAIGARAE